MAFRILVTRRIPEDGLKLLEQAGAELDICDDCLTKTQIINRIKDKDGLICLLSDKIDADIITAGTKLKVISNYAVGYDNIDIKTAGDRGIYVTNTPGALTDATAELAWALLLAAARRIAEADRFCRVKKFKGWEPFLMRGPQLRGKTLGIIGAGRIGTAFAMKGRGFDMNLLYYSRSRNELLERELGGKKVDLEELLKRSDFVSLHLPLTSETKHLLKEREFSMMKENAIIVNTSRGAVIDEKDLASALKDRRIGGAALDVYEAEPYINEDLLSLDNVVLAPHIGSATIEARAQMSIMVAQSVIAVMNGKKPENCVNM